MSQTKALINRSALRENLEIVKKNAYQAKVFAVIKANAYGHGMLEIADALSYVGGADGFAVARIEEAMLLREHGIKQPLLVLSGFTNDHEIELASHYDLDTVIHSEHQLTLLEKAHIHKPITVWLKINTGMNRLGVDPTEVRSFNSRLEMLYSIRKPIKMMTHLLSADNQESLASENQIAIFDTATSGFGGEQSIANSAGLLGWAMAQRHWVRPGIMLYGASPFITKTAQECELLPVMTLMSQVISIRHVPKGQSVGYGATWVAPESRRIASIGIGYGDGYPRHAVEGTPLLIAGQEATLVGRVSMDSITVDVSGCEDVQVGDEVVLWGKGLPIERIAEKSATISYELLCGVTSRVPRIYQG